MGAKPVVARLQSEATPLIVASMIVRDEAAMLGDCLASLQDFVDEIVVCDTGSSDGTIQIARSAGARVIEREWCDDFAAVRNEALAECRHADWILWIDADERLECRDPDAVRDVLRSSGDHTPQAHLVELENRRGSGEDSVALVPRLFRPGELSFHGRVHEELRRPDGSVPQAGFIGGVRIDHLGYDDEIVEARGKAGRNLALAEAAFESDPAAESLLDLVRSLLFAGRPPTEALALIDESFDPARGSDPTSGELLAIRSNLKLELEDVEGAFDDSADALAVLPEHDVAAAVFSRAATDLGRFEELVEAIDRPRGDITAVRVPGNRAEALALAASAALVLGRVDDSRRLFGDAADVLDGFPSKWSRLLDAMSGAPASEAIPIICAAGADDPEPVVGAARAIWTPELVSALEAGFATDNPQPDEFGISFSFGSSRLPVGAQLLAEWVPRNRRVVEWSGYGELRSRLVESGCTVTSIEPESVVSDLKELAHEEAEFDVLLGGVDSNAEEIVRSASDLVDPSGIIGLWTIDGDGMASPGSPVGDLLGSPGGGIDVARLESIGFMSDPAAPSGLVALRPVWSAASIGRRSLVHEGQVWIWSREPLSDEMCMAYRACVPGSIAVEFVPNDVGADSALADLPQDAAVLVTTPGVVPEPRWVQASFDAFATGSRPSGPRLIDTEHRVVHAGMSAEGRPIGAGEPSSSPLLQTDRQVAAMGAPFVAAAEPLRCDPRPGGDVLGAAVAITVDPVETGGPGVGLDEMFGSSVLLLGGPAPGRAHRDLAGDLEKLFERLVESGLTPIYQWEDRAWSPDPPVLQRWRQRGVVAFPPSPLRREPARFTPDPERPRADALAAAFNPAALVYLSPESLRWDFATASGVSVAPSFYVGREAGEQATRADAVCDLSAVADRILEDVSREAVESHVAIPAIERIDHVAGLVSIVIPVFDKWDLTERCLRSIEAHTKEPYEIVVVDNGSTDGTKEGLARSGATVVANEQNLGFPRAVNQGIAASRGEFVCILNNDTEVTSGWLEAMLTTLSVPGTGLVGPRSNRIAGLQQVPGAPLITQRKAASKWATEWKSRRVGRSWRIRRLIGFCLLARRETFEDIGGFDEGFGIGNFEDDELGVRVMDSGLDLRVADDAVVLHHGGATFQDLDLDFPVVMRDAQRHLGGRRSGSSVSCAALVLSDGNPVGAAISAATAAPIADRIRIAERGPVGSTELAAAGIRGTAVEVVGADWAGDPSAAAALTADDSRWLLVIGSHERVENGDWGEARAELESLEASAAAVATPSGSEVRLVAPGPGALGSIGDEDGHPVTTFRLESQSAG